jgi:glyoxylase-like metal-dependent hydrolase (beta-lactamase superfamily II)
MTHAARLRELLAGDDPIGAPVTLTEHLVPIVHRRVFNAYLVLEDDGLTLVDTGPAGALPAIRAAVQRLGAPLRRVVLTHAHADHLGGLDQLAAADGELEVIAGRREAALLAGDLTLRDGEPGPAPKRRSYGRPATRPTRLVDDGEHIGSLKVIATPGHTPGHISVIDTRDGTLIAGDALTTLGRVAVSGDLVWRWPFPALSTWNKQVAVQGAQRLHDEEPVRLATGHRPIVRDAARAIARALHRARR